MKKINSQKVTYFASVTVIAILVAVSLQFTKAVGTWLPPSTVAPLSTVPLGTIGAPITIGSALLPSDQIKEGYLRVDGFISTGGDVLLDSDVVVGNKMDNTSFTAEQLMFADGSLQSTALEKNVPDTLCIAPDGTGLCADNFYMKGANKCCPFNSTVATLADTWYKIDAVSFSVSQNTSDTGSWSTPKDLWFQPVRNVSAVRVSGSSNDGGYCYAFWGTGHVETTRHATNRGKYNMDNKNYSGAVRTCGRGICSTTGSNCPTNPASFDNNGDVKICQAYTSAGGMGTAQKTGLNIPSGTSIHLKGSHTMGIKDDNVTCTLEVQYAP